LKSKIQYSNGGDWVKRPLTVVGLTYMCGLVFAMAVGVRYAVYMAVILGLAGIASFAVPKIRKGRAIPVVCLTIAAAIVLYVGAVQLYVQPVSALKDTQAQVTATVTKAPYYSGAKIVYPVKTTYVRGYNAPQEINLLLYTTTPIAVDYYDSIECTVQFYEASADTYKNYLYAHGVYISSYINEDESVATVTNSYKPFAYWFLVLQDKIEEAIDEILPNTQASLAKALFIGDKSNLDASIKDSFSSSGVSHILVVSGLHLTIIAMCFYKLIKKLLGHIRLACIGGIIAVILFVVISGFSMSVMRSGIMMTMFFIGKMLNRNNDSLNSLGLAALILTLFNPLGIGDMGMLMSFSATLGIIVLYGRIKNPIMNKVLHSKYAGLINAVASPICVSLSAVIFTLPVTICAFGTVSLYFLLTNLLVSFVMPLTLMSIVLMVCFFYVPFLSFLAYAFGFVAGVLCNYLLWVTGTVSSLPYAVINVDKPFVYFWLAATILIIGVGFIMGKGRINHIRYIAASSVSIFVISVAVYSLTTGEDVTLHILDTGGNMVAVTYKDNTAILSCGGSYRRASQYMYSLGEITREPQLLIIPDKSWETSQLAPNILNSFDVENVLVYSSKKYKNSLYLQLAGTDNVNAFDNTYTTTLWDRVKVSIAMCDDSTWLSVKIDDVTILLCPPQGDCAALSQQVLSPTYAVMAKAPKNMDILTADTVILTSADDEYAIQQPTITMYSDDIRSTIQGDISLTVSPMKDVSIWQK